MSVDIEWETLTTGSDGARLAETVRAFVHDKFQQVTLPRFIRSVHVHSFDFGSVSPEIEIKDICDPLPDFYEEDEDTSDSDENGDQAATEAHSASEHHNDTAGSITCDSYGTPQPPHLPHIDTRPTGMRTSLRPMDRPASPFFPTSQAPGIPGGTSNLTYFHLPFGPGLSGTTTPLAAVAGAHFTGGWPDSASNSRRIPPPSPFGDPHTSASASAADPASRPQSQHQHHPGSISSSADDDQPLLPGLTDAPPSHVRDPEPNDIQTVAHVKYSGNLRLSLTAEILLDYPMPSFVGIPLQLNITGLAFDGVAILAYIKKRAHVCFLSPEDAEAFAGRANDLDDLVDTTANQHARIGGLLEEIKVESEIGQKENGKQVLKNVGKVEKFVLEQVRRIFEDEFVYPSFWTFLV
jgi:distribution and morphology protein 12